MAVDGTIPPSRIELPAKFQATDQPDRGGAVLGTRGILVHRAQPGQDHRPALACPQQRCPPIQRAVRIDRIQARAGPRPIADVRTDRLRLFPVAESAARDATWASTCSGSVVVGWCAVQHRPVCQQLFREGRHQGDAFDRRWQSSPRGNGTAGKLVEEILLGIQIRLGDGGCPGRCHPSCCRRGDGKFSHG